MRSIKRVLVIDDEPDIRNVLELTMSSLAGWQVLSAGSGIEGLRRAWNHLPDLILLDVMMPDMDGPETLRVLGSIDQVRDIPVIFMTAKARFSAGRTIVKPFDPATLIDQINYLVQETDSAPIDSTLVPAVDLNLRPLWERYKSDTLRKVEVVRRAAMLQQEGTLDEQLCQLAEWYSHTLAGTAGLFGFADASVASKLLQDAFENNAEHCRDADLVELADLVRNEFEKPMAVC